MLTSHIVSFSELHNPLTHWHSSTKKNLNEPHAVNHEQTSTPLFCMTEMESEQERKREAKKEREHVTDK